MRKKFAAVGALVGVLGLTLGMASVAGADDFTADQSTVNAASTRRGPSRSESHPPRICIAAYGYANAEKISPSSVGVSASSLLMSGPATEIFTRST